LAQKKKAKSQPIFAGYDEGNLLDAKQFLGANPPKIAFFYSKLKASPKVLPLAVAVGS